MRCPNWVKYKTTKRGNVIVDRRATRAWHYGWGWKHDDDTPGDQGFELCGGELIVKVEAGIEDGCGCCGHAEVRVRVLCSKCGEAWLHGLLGDYDAAEQASALLTERLRNIGQATALRRMRDERARMGYAL